MAPDRGTGELQTETIVAVSNVVISGLVDICANLFDVVDLVVMCAWSAAGEARALPCCVGDHERASLAIRRPDSSC